MALTDLALTDTDVRTQIDMLSAMLCIQLLGILVCVTVNNYHGTTAETGRTDSNILLPSDDTLSINVSITALRNVRDQNLKRLI